MAGQPQVVSYGAPAFGASVGASIAAPMPGNIGVSGPGSRVTVPHEIFAKLAAGGTLTPEEMSQLTGQPAPGAEGFAPGMMPSPAAGASAAVSAAGAMGASIV